MPDSNIYACHRCGEVDVKLWRMAQSLTVELSCVNCLSVMLAEDPDHAFDVKDIREDGTRIHPEMKTVTDQISWYVPAVYCEDDLPDLYYWGYTSGPDSDWERWRKTPLHPRVPGEELPPWTPPTSPESNPARRF